MPAKDWRRDLSILVSSQMLMLNLHRKSTNTADVDKEGCGRLILFVIAESA